jgi:hypothetical protein
MSDLNQFIRNHRDEFDDVEPDPGHFGRFESRLQKEAVTTVGKRNAMLRIAAMILILISVSVFLFDFATHEIMTRFGAGKSQVEMPGDVAEAIRYYDDQAIQQLSVISRLTGASPEARLLSESSLQELASLDDDTRVLKDELSSNPNNERILAALIQNQQMKEGIMRTIIHQLSQIQQ